MEQATQNAASILPRAHKLPSIPSPRPAFVANYNIITFFLVTSNDPRKLTCTRNKYYSPNLEHLHRYKSRWKFQLAASNTKSRPQISDNNTFICTIIVNYRSICGRRRFVIDVRAFTTLSLFTLVRPIHPKPCTLRLHEALFVVQIGTNKGFARGDASKFGRSYKNLFEGPRTPRIFDKTKTRKQRAQPHVAVTDLSTKFAKIVVYSRLLCGGQLRVCVCGDDDDETQSTTNTKRDSSVTKVRT